MRQLRVAALALLASIVLLVPAHADFFKEATTLTVAPAVIEPNTDFTMTLSGVDPGAWNMLLISTMQGTGMIGGVELGVQPPYLLTFIGLSGLTGQITINKHIESVPPELWGQAFAVQGLSLKVLMGPMGLTVNFYTSNVETFSFYNPI
ncbi:MAG: hypothetical protein AB1486_17155 [Planctomycetota bacterium]